MWEPDAFDHPATNRYDRLTASPTNHRINSGVESPYTQISIAKSEEEMVHYLLSLLIIKFVNVKARYDKNALKL